MPNEGDRGLQWVTLLQISHSICRHQSLDHGSSYGELSLEKRNYLKNCWLKWNSMKTPHPFSWKQLIYLCPFLWEAQNFPVYHCKEGCMLYLWALLKCQGSVNGIWCEMSPLSHRFVTWSPQAVLMGTLCNLCTRTYHIILDWKNGGWKCHATNYILLLKSIPQFLHSVSYALVNLGLKKLSFHNPNIWSYLITAMRRISIAAQDRKWEGGTATTELCGFCWAAIGPRQVTSQGFIMR